MRKGRFKKPAAEIAQRYGESVSFDRRLYRYDIAGSIAHAAALARAGIISVDELQKIEIELRAIEKEIESGKFEWHRSLEDVHMNIEAALTNRIGAAGAKLHTARSRNDQIALDLRLYLREETDAISRSVKQMQAALVTLAERNADVIIPGYTHLQRAQPVLFAHHLLAYVEMLARDAERLADGLRRVNVCPLGSGALAGSTLPLNRAAVARTLGFVDEHGRLQISANSMDAVSDRDFAVEFCA